MYQGWSNYETWCVKLWIDNEEGSHLYWGERARERYEESKEENDELHAARCALADELKEAFEDAAPELQGMWADLLNAALSEVNWYEMAGSMLEDAKENDDA
jgi:hypothetical protein